MRARDWRTEAACLDEDPELFFPVVEEGPLCADQVAAAKAVCARCPVRRLCLDDASGRLTHGIAGGLTAEERRARRAQATPVSLRSPRRELGIALMATGESPRAVADLCGVCDRTVQRWKELSA